MSAANQPDLSCPFVHESLNPQIFDGDHDGCPVVREGPEGKLIVCGCECRRCKRAWWAAGRPILRDGVVVRETRDPINDRPVRR